MQVLERSAVTDQAFSELGLSPDADAVEIRNARRRLAREHHPDLGGDPARMTAINEAAATALRSLYAPRPVSSDEVRRDRSAAKLIDDWNGVTQDVASFTVEALPVETFEGLLISAAVMGEIVDDDPPYRLETCLSDPVRCWCRLEVVPDAGSSTVSLTIGPMGTQDTSTDLPNIEQVRDIWVDTLNQINWS